MSMGTVASSIDSTIHRTVRREFDVDWIAGVGWCGPRWQEAGEAQRKMLDQEARIQKLEAAVQTALSGYRVIRNNCHEPGDNQARAAIKELDRVIALLAGALKP